MALFPLCCLSFSLQTSQFIDRYAAGLLETALPRRPIRKSPARIAVDTGGTFTDCVWVEDGRLKIVKVFSTPHDPAEAIANALAGIVDPNREVVLLHGTTVGTNALLQRKGARTALVTT